MIARVVIVAAAAFVLCAAGVESLGGTRMEAAQPLLTFAALGSYLLLFLASVRALSRGHKTGFAGLGICFCGLILAVLSFAPGGDRVIGRTVAPDGTEMCILQRFTGFWAEPYRVEFYYRRPGQRWGSFYYEHEDTRWWLGSISVAADGKNVTIRKFLLPVAYFDIPAESFTIVRWNRSISPAQTWMPADWKPESEISRRPEATDH